MTPDRDSIRVKVAAPPELLRMIVPKGYIAVDGVSLTVVDVHPGSALSSVAAEGGWFSVMLIAYTQAHVTLPRKRIGERVNLEVDVVGKCVVLIQ
jgi:riboflavin synthase